MQLNLEEIQAVLECGDAARELMLQPAFHSTIDYLSNYHLSALVAAPIGESGREARDHHHTMHTAIREIATEITGRIAAADELRARLGAEQEDDE
jgi:hypothetical protein